MDRKHHLSHAPRRQDDDNLKEALSGPSADWIEAALAQAGSGEEVLLAAIDAAVLATALARRAVAYLEHEAVRRGRRGVGVRPQVAQMWRYVLQEGYPQRPCAGEHELAAAQVSAASPCPALVMGLCRASGDHCVSVDIAGTTVVRVRRRVAAAGIGSKARVPPLLHERPESSNQRGPR